MTNGYNYSDIGTEYDTLTGGTGADTFVLGNTQEIYYGDDYDYGFATITDFSSAEGDTIQLSDSGIYYLGYGNNGGTSATDTFIYEYDFGLIGVVQDTTTLSFTYA